MSDAYRPDRPLLLAHRGDHRRAPENTLAAFRAALAVPGCDGLELDVRLARDGTPVVAHDPDLERVFGRAERVGDLDPEVLATLGVPTLAETLRLARPPAFLDIELKERPTPALLALVRRERGEGSGLRAAVVSSFLADALHDVRSAEPGWPLWLNALDLDARTVRLARDLGCAGVSVEWSALDKRSVGRAREAGLTVAAWTVVDPAVVERLAGLGVVAVCVEGAALSG